MKTKKTFIFVFLTAFFIGYVFVLTTEKVIKPIEISVTQPEISTIPSFQTIPELETIDEVNSWDERKEYPLKIKLLETGDGFHGAEINARNGETWLGLFEENGEFYMRSTKLKIKRVFDPVTDEEDKKKTGKSVEVSDKKEPLFLIKNAKKLREGKVSTFFKGFTWNEYFNEYVENGTYPEEDLTYLKKDFVKNYEIGGKKYELKVIEAKNIAGDNLLALALESNGTRQILHTIYDSGYFVGTLFLIGDLDHDNKPDFYFELFESENVNNKVLFLSSEAEKGKLVKKIAYFWTTVC